MIRFGPSNYLVLCYYFSTLAIFMKLVLKYLREFKGENLAHDFIGCLLYCAWAEPKAAGGGSFKADWEEQEKQAQGKIVPALCNHLSPAKPHLPKFPEALERVHRLKMSARHSGVLLVKLQQESEDIKENLKGKVVRLL